MRDAAARGRALSRAIESTLGRAAFEAFRATSRAFQRDRVSCERFYDYLTAVLHAHPGLLLEVLATLPDDAKRRRLESLASRAEAAAASAERDERCVATPSTASVASRSSNRASSSSAAPSTPRRRRGSRTKPSASATLPAMITKTRRRPTNARRGVALNPTRRVKRTPPRFYDVVPADDPASAPVLRLNQGTRGRVILPIDRFPERLRRLTLSCVALARSATRETPHPMPAMRPTTTLVNFYKENASFKWHRDSEDPELQRTNKAPPIVSFTVGLSAEFAYKRRYSLFPISSVRLDWSRATVGHPEIGT